MEVKTKVLAVSVALVAGLIATDGLAQKKLKRAEGDDFSEKLENRFPEESKRGGNSIFRKVAKDDDKAEVDEKKEGADSKTKRRISPALGRRGAGPRISMAPKPKDSGSKDNSEKSEGLKGLAALFGKKDAGESTSEDKDKKANSPKEEKKKVVKTPDAPKKKEQDKEDAEESTGEADQPKERKGLAAIFGKRDVMKNDGEADDSADAVEIEATGDSAGEDGATADEEQPKERKGLAAIFEKREVMKDEVEESADEEEVKETEAAIVAKPTSINPDEDDADVEEEMDDDKSREVKGLAALFGKKDSDKKRAGPVELVEPEREPIVALPGSDKKVAKIKQDPVKNEDGTTKFASWDDLPYKEKSTVDKMMNKLQFKPTSPKRQLRLPPPLSLPVPAPTSTPPTTESSEKSESEAKPAETKPAETKSDAPEPAEN